MKRFSYLQVSYTEIYQESMLKTASSLLLPRDTYPLITSQRSEIY